MKTDSTHKEETVLKGIPASPGIIIGLVFLFQKQAPVFEERSIPHEDVDRELGRLEQAVARSHKELRKILEFAEKKLGEDKVKIFEAQLMFLEDAVLFDAIFARIRKELKNAEFVVNDEIGSTTESCSLRRTSTRWSALMTLKMCSIGCFGIFRNKEQSRAWKDPL